MKVSLPRPAPGFPAGPEHMEKAKLGELPEVERNKGVELTGSVGVYPGAGSEGGRGRKEGRLRWAADR